MNMSNSSAVKQQSSRKKRRKKRKNWQYNIALVYIVTIVVSLVLLGGVAIFIYTKYIEPTQNQTQPTTGGASIPLFQAENEHNQTTLFILDTSTKNSELIKTDIVFMLGRFVATEDKLILVPLQSDTFSQIGVEKLSLYDFYKKGGILKLVDAAENALNIPIEKYMRFDKDSFNELSDTLGGVQFKVPMDLSSKHPQTEEQYSLTAGNQTLDGIMIRKLITYPEYKGGEEYRMKVTASAVTDMINQALGTRLASTLETSFNRIINIVDTNITANDFTFRQTAIVSAINSGSAQFSVTVGKYNDKSQYVLDEKYKEELSLKLKVTPILQ